MSFHTRLDLPDVTLVAVSSVALAATVRAMRLSQREINFGAMLLLSDKPAEDMGAIDWHKIDPIRSRADYSNFILAKLHSHIETSHLLCVQWDGYVLRPDKWDPAFLNFDYIGAPWPHFASGGRVGNGGFSLRSSRLLSICADLGIEGELEDVEICRTHRSRLESKFGIRFAPEDVAARFAWERAKPRGDEFGFHGMFNLVKHTAQCESVRVLDELEPFILNMREHKELLRWAVMRGRWRLAASIFNRIKRQMARP